MKQHNTYEDMPLLLSEIDKHKVLDADTQKMLVVQAQQGDERARNMLVSSNMRFVIALASKYKKSNVSIQELISEGNLGLIDAIGKYNPNKNTTFISYAATWIRHYIERFIHQSSPLVRVPMNKVRMINQLKREEAILVAEDILNDSEIIEALSMRLNVSVAMVQELQSYAKESVSLNNSIKSEKIESIEHIDILEDTQITPVDVQIENDNNRELLIAFMKTIPKRESAILAERYGLKGIPKSLSELSTQYGISKERVRQLEMKGISRLKERYAHIVQAYEKKSPMHKTHASAVA